MNELIDLTLEGEKFDSFPDQTARKAIKPTVKMYGAVGDGATDDTAAVQAALAAERVVYITGGTYRLTGPLVIRENCELELAQDAVLQFEQTEGNAITLLRSATLRGNHATVFVPYAFTGNVINADTADDDAALGDFGDLTDDELNTAKATANNTAVPPFSRWDPQWKMSRYVTDINICKRNASGFHYSDDGACSGTAVNLHCDATTRPSYKWTYMWGVNMSGVRIAGAFDYGIHAHNTGDHMESWNHDMRIEAVMDGCKIGVMIDNCYYSRFAVTIQARAAADGTTYAQHGVKIVDSQGIDLSSSRVWDWENGNTSLWEDGGEYQHIALVGNCRGLILDDYLCHKVSDIREHIYTDTTANFGTMTILQEPGNKWFRSRDGEPYFYDGVGETKLLTQAELDAYFAVETVKTFEDVLATATDTDGSVYNGIGYKTGYRLNADGSVITSDSTYTLTGFMPCTVGQKVYVAEMFLTEYDGVCRFCLYDADKNFIRAVAAELVLSDNYYMGGEETESGFWFSPKNVSGNENTAYVRFNLFTRMVGDAPMVSIDDPIKYTAEGFLGDGVKVKGESLVLTTAGGKAYSLAVSDDGALTAVEIT